MQSVLVYAYHRCIRHRNQIQQRDYQHYRRVIRNISDRDNEQSPMSVGNQAKDEVFRSLSNVPIIGAAVATATLTYGTNSVARTQYYNATASNANGGISSVNANDKYTEFGGLKTCRILNGMWQVGGYHGYQSNKVDTVAAMTKCANEGFTTFDLADIYGPAEEYVGAFKKGNLASDLSKSCQYFTKWVPRPQAITRAIVTDAIDHSLNKMNTDRLDLLQFHWWDYNNKYYYNAMAELMHLQQDNKILNIGLCNFDTDHMVDLIDQNAPIVSNQVAFSIVDTRPLIKMIPACAEKNVKLLVYGSLMGGFLSSYWLNRPEPDAGSLSTVSLKKYYPWIYQWGGWGLFQELLMVLDVIAKKHKVSLSNVALKWVLNQSCVGGTIVGIRFGLSDHLKDNERVFSLLLDDDDNAAIATVQAKSKNLMNVFGDCGGEYHKA